MTTPNKEDSLNNSEISESIPNNQPENLENKKNENENENNNQNEKDNSNQKIEENQTQNETPSLSTEIQNLPTPSPKDSKWFFENVINKLSQKKSQTISVSIFMFLRDNNYKPMSMQTLLDKLSEKFQKDPRTILKYKTLKDQFL